MSTEKKNSGIREVAGADPDNEWSSWRLAARYCQGSLLSGVALVVRLILLSAGRGRIGKTSDRTNNAELFVVVRSFLSHFKPCILGALAPSPFA